VVVDNEAAIAFVFWKKIAAASPLNSAGAGEEVGIEEASVEEVGPGDPRVRAKEFICLRILNLRAGVLELSSPTLTR
jgi:hypothetical protein